MADERKLKALRLHKPKLEAKHQELREEQAAEQDADNLTRPRGQKWALVKEQFTPGSVPEGVAV